MFEQIQEAVQYIQTRTALKPQIGIVLGTGLGNLTSEIEIIEAIPYKDIPYFPISTVQSHKGQLVIGHLAGKVVVAMSGRFHYYEGYSMKEVTFPIRVLKFLGIEQLIISNAAGSVNAHIDMGDVVFIKDHINLLPENPLRGVNDERLGIRFPDMLHTYNKPLNKRALELAQELQIPAHEGVYIATQGPNLETPAEYNSFHIMGADVVGMSTVPEVIVAKHMNLRPLVVSVVSNRCYPIDTIKEATVEEMINAVKATEPKLTKLIKALISEL